MLQEKIDHYVREIKRKFRLKLQNPVPKVVVVEPFPTSMRSRRFGTTVKSNVIRLSKEFLNSPLLEGILVRELMRSFLPRILLPIEEAMDIAMFVAYKLLPNKEEWLKQWEKVAPQKYLGDISYWPSHDYLEFDKATAGKSIKIFLDLLEEITKYREKFDSEEYIYFFDYIQKEVYTPITQIDIELIETLKEDPQISFLRLSELIGRSESVIRRTFKRLEARIWLRIQAYLNWSKINLEHITVLIKPVEKFKEEVREKLLQPYIRNIRMLGGGRGTELSAVYTLPIGTSHTLDEFLRSMKENAKIRSYIKTQSKKDIQMMCFKYYDANEKTWNIPWEEISKKFGDPIQEIKNAMLTNVVELDYISEPTQFDQTDLKILGLLYWGDGLKRSIKELTQQVGTSRNALKDRLRRLQDEQFYLPRLAFIPLLCSLPETLLLVVESDDNETLMKIEYVLQSLPLTYVLRVRGDIDGIISLSALPDRITDVYKRLAFQIARLPEVCTIRSYIEHHGTMISRLLPVELFTRDCQWIHPKEIWRVE
ncbi:MAG: winged helix-turn-helix transcriptional regulator [Candidatus Hodarchaeota archaeon]